MQGDLDTAHTGLASLEERLETQEGDHNNTKDFAAEISSAVSAVETRAMFNFATIADDMGELQTDLAAQSLEIVQQGEDIDKLQLDQVEVSKQVVTNTANIATLGADKASKDDVSMRCDSVARNLYSTRRRPRALGWKQMRNLSHCVKCNLTCIHFSFSYLLQLKSAVDGLEAEIKVDQDELRALQAEIADKVGVCDSQHTCTAN
jgi:hypothetical protein